MQAVVVNIHPLAGSYHFEVAHDIRHGNALEIVGLATAQDGRKNLVLFGGRQDENGVCRRFLQGLQERIEGGLGQHVHFIDDVYAVFPHLGRDAHLIDQSLDVVYTIVGRCIQFVNTKRTAFCKGATGLALPARRHIRPRIGAVDHLGEDTCRGRLADTTGSAEQVGMRQLTAQNGIFERLGDIVLSDQAVKILGPVFSGGNFV